MTAKTVTAGEIPQTYQQIMDQIGEAAEKSGRRAKDVLMVAVTKYAMPDQIRALLELGHRDLGESRSQQLEQRAAQMDEFLSRRRSMGAAVDRDADQLPDKCRWHMIGHMQRNKTKQVVPLVELIHSVDSLRLAEDLHAFGQRTDRVIDILLQVNVSGEESKFGCALPAAIHLADQIDTMLFLRLRGIMCMAPKSDNPEDSRQYYARGRELFEDFKKESVAEDHLTVLSMGMSNDYTVAIEEGANMVRLGRALFGEMPTE